MSERVVKVPDVGEGVAEAELLVWHVAVGDVVEADQALAEVMTDKATVEIPSPVAGTITWISGQPGEVLAVGSELVRIAAPGSAPTTPTPTPTSTTPDPTSDPAASTTPGAPAATTPTSTTHTTAATAPAAATHTATPHTAAAAGPGAAGAVGAGTRVGLGVGTGRRVMAAPAVRLRAVEAGIDLRVVAGSGPAGRITHADLDAFLAVVGARSGPGASSSEAAGADAEAADPGAASARAAGAATSGGAAAGSDTGAAAAGTEGTDEVTEVPIIGLRRRIAQRLSEANTRVPAITYVDEVDVTLLQQRRTTLNADADADADRPARPKLTLLPFLVAAIVDAVQAYPNCNAHYDDALDGGGTLRVHRGVHVGIATQTRNGLLVPVLRHAETRDLFDIAAEIDRLATTARDGTATSAELSGSTITITSLGALGGLVTTPIINRPEVAIVGVNKLQVRPVWDGSAFQPRSMMNLSSSFDHRIVDGWDAAQFVQHIKRGLEAPEGLLDAGHRP